MQDGRKKNFIFFFSSALFVYICIRKELFDRNTPHITEFATVAKSLPHSLKKLISRLFLIYSYFNIVFFHKINLSQQVMIVKHTDDNEIYVGWPELGYEIKLSEFTQVEL